MHNFYPHKIQSSVTAQLIFRQLVKVLASIYRPTVPLRSCGLSLSRPVHACSVTNQYRLWVDMISLSKYMLDSSSHRPSRRPVHNTVVAASVVAAYPEKQCVSALITGTRVTVVPWSAPQRSRWLVARVACILASIQLPTPSTARGNAAAAVATAQHGFHAAR